jgi:hypothetical protein
VFCAAFALVNVWSAFAHEQLERDRVQALFPELDDVDETPRRDRSSGEHPERYWKYVPDARRTRLALIVGMSQLLTISDRRRSDRFTSEHMDDALAPDGVRVFEFGAPNMDNEEALVYLLAASVDPATHPYAFIYGVCFDKFRNVDVRPALLRLLQNRPRLLSAWKEVAATYADRYPRATAKMLATLGDLAKQAETTREATFESRLRILTGRWLPLVAARESFNGHLQSVLYRLRNYALNIESSTKRPIIGTRYDLNREFLGLIAALASERGIKFLPYVIPLNPLADTPYVASEYASFKGWLQEFSQIHGLPFVNLENLVPSQEWGRWQGGPDFKHFGAAAHRRTGSALVAAFRAQLVDGASAAAP